MNGAACRNKGNRFELVVAKAFSQAFGETLRRVPLSGGHTIKSDIYNPTDDSFPYFIECKNRASFTLRQLTSATSNLAKIYARTVEEASKHHAKERFERGPAPLVVFKGGHFEEPCVLFGNYGYLHPFIGGQANIGLTIFCEYFGVRKCKARKFEVWQLNHGYSTQLVYAKLPFANLCTLATFLKFCRKDHPVAK